MVTNFQNFTPNNLTPTEALTANSILTNGSLRVVIRENNGAIDTIRFGGSDFFNPGTPVSNFGFQKGTDTSTFVLNNTTGFTQQSVMVTSTDASVVVTGTYTKGGADVDFIRTYSLVDEFNVVKVETEFVNNGSDLTLSYFDTFDPDQGIDKNTGFGTFNDVLNLETAFGEAKIAQATERRGLTFLLGSLDSNMTVASGGPFEINMGSSLNNFFSSPVDGNGNFLDSGTHIGMRLELTTGESENLVYYQAYGRSSQDAQEQLIQAVGAKRVDGTTADDNLPGTSTIDLILGLEGDDSLTGEAGNDFLAGGLGNDVLEGGEGDDVLRGDLNQRNSQVNIAGGNDTLRGGSGNDRLGGKSGNDQLFGDEGDDELFGDNGDDILRGGIGNDRLVGDDFSMGQGSDIFVLAPGEGTDTIVDFEDGIDFIGLAEGITFAQLSITSDINSNALIGFGNETLAILKGVASNDLTNADFVVTGF